MDNETEERFSHGERTSMEVFDRDNNSAHIVVSNPKLIGKGTFGRVFEIHVEDERWAKKSRSKIG